MILNCPHCSVHAHNNFDGIHWQIECEDCAMAGPRCLTADEAERYWNKIARAAGSMVGGMT